MRQVDDKLVVRPESREVGGEEGSGLEEKEVYIPDYVMIDFGGVPEAPHSPKG